MDEQAYRTELKIDALWAALSALDAGPYPDDTYVRHCQDGWWAVDREWTPAGTYHNHFAYLGKTNHQAVRRLRRWIRNLKHYENPTA